MSLATVDVTLLNPWSLASATSAYRGVQQLGELVDRCPHMTREAALAAMQAAAPPGLKIQVPPQGSAVWACVLPPALAHAVACSSYPDVLIHVCLCLCLVLSCSLFLLSSSLFACLLPLSVLLRLCTLRSARSAR